MAEPTSPGRGPSTSEAALSDLKKRIARGNEETQKAVSRLRARERAACAAAQVGSALTRNYSHSCVYG
jgi:hypothetical protein